MYNFKGLLFHLSISACLIGCSDEDDSPDIEFQAPIAIEATSIGEDGFTANWIEVLSADSYLLDVSAEEDFSAFVGNLQDVPTSGSSYKVSGLEDNTTYYYRLRAVAGSEVSAFSNSSQVRTAEMEEPFVPVDQPDIPLKDYADFPIGMAVQAGRMTALYDQRLSGEFTSLTAEYEMKMNIMYPSSDSFNFEQADAIVEYAEANDMQVHGHALIWHNATPSWVTNFSGTNQEFEQMVEDYITTVVTRYKGRVRSWDVVNEAIEDGNGQLRNSVFLQKMGADYVAKCHQWARNADPDVLLFYNDYNIEFDAQKQQAMLDLVDDFIDRGVPIDGVGFQMHISYNFPSKSQLESITGEVVNRGLMVHYSELDVRANPNGTLTQLNDTRAEEQGAKVEEVVSIFASIPTDQRFAITVWGLRDSDTWLIDFWGNPEWPLLFYDDFKPKPAHTGFLRGLGWQP